MVATKPDCSAEKLEDYLLYLDGLRDSGITNMFGAAEYLEEEFDVSRKEARNVLFYWMDTFEERHNVGA